MKRFTSLMLMLLCAVTTMWAGPTDLPQITTDLENPIYYTISNTRSEGKVIYYTAEGVKDENPQVLTDAHKFFFTGTSLEDLRIHNAEAEKSGLLFNGSGEWTAEGTSCKISVTPHSSNAGLAIEYNGTSLNEHNGNRNTYCEWSANDEGSIYVMDLVAAWPEAEKLYVIEAPLFEASTGVAKGLYANEDGSLGWKATEIDNKAFIWTVEYNTENGYAIKNYATEKYLSYVPADDRFVVTETVEHYASLTFLSQGQFNINVNGGTMHAGQHGNGYAANGNVVSWGGQIGSASAWAFVECQDPDALVPITITYNFTYKGEATEYTQTVETFVGEEYPKITVEFPFGITATKPAGAIAAGAETTVTIALEENLPFVYAASYEDITKWYYIQQHSSAGYGKYLQYAETYIEWADATMTAGEADTYTWAFVGDPFNGFKMVNYGAPAETNAVVSNGSGNPSFGALADATAWNIKASRTDNDAEHFCFQYPGSDQYMNAQSGKIAFWGDADQGSTMWVTERDLTGLADLQALIDQVEAAIEAYGEGGTTVGYYTAASTEALAVALAQAKAAAAANTSAAANAAAQTALQNAVAALEIIMPEEGKFYRIVSHCTKDHRANQEVYVSKDGDMHFGKIADNVAAGTIGHIFQFVPANDGKFYIYNVQRGVYMQAVGSQGVPAVVTTDVNNAKPVAIKHLGVDNVIGIYPDGQNMMHAQDASSKIVGWNSTDVNDASAWVITEVANIAELYQEVAMSEVGYATLCLGYNAAIPTGLEAYAVSSVSDGFAIMDQVTDVIPANEAVILKLAKDASAGTFNFVYAASADGVEKNLLEGTTVDANMTEDAYVLGKVDEVVGLYIAEKNQLDGTAWLNNANKAYLVVPAEQAEGIACYSFRFGEGTTGIENVTTENVNVTGIYDLTGRRVEAITAPGIYVVNGKKVLVK